MSVASWCSTCFCVVLCVGFCTGHFVMVPLNLNIYIVYNILSFNISLIYIIFINNMDFLLPYLWYGVYIISCVLSMLSLLCPPREVSEDMSMTCSLGSLWFVVSLCLACVTIVRGRCYRTVSFFNILFCLSLSYCT